MIFAIGVTEPIEFAFMFVAPILFVTYLSLFIAVILHWTAGFSFSAVLSDFVLSLVNTVSNQPWMLLVQSVIFFILYYAKFRVVIQVINLNSIGRLDNERVDPTVNVKPDDESISSTQFKGKYHHLTITQILEGLGGSENITSITNCAHD